MTQLWTSRRIEKEVDSHAEYYADASSYAVPVLMVEYMMQTMRDEYEARIAELMSAITLANTALDLGGEHVEELKAEINVANARIAMLSEEVTMLYRDRN